MADGKYHVRVELTFHKTLPTQPVYKKRAKSRRQPAPSAGELPHQPTAANRPPPPTTRPTPPARRRRQPTTPEKETTPLATQTLQIDTSINITVPRSEKTAQIMPSPIIQKSYTASFSKSPPSKKPRAKSPAMNTASRKYIHVNIEEEYPLHETYELQDVTSTKYEAIAKAARLPKRRRRDQRYLSVYFVYHRDNQYCTLIKGPT